MRAFARNASSRDEEDPESPTASVSGPNTPVDYSGTTTGLKGRPTARFSSIELIQRDFSNETPETKSLRQRQLVSIAELRMEMASLASLHAKAARHYKRRYYILMLPSIFLSIAITAFVGLAAPAGCHSGWWRKVTISVLSGINALITALLAFLKYPQKLDAHDQARLRFTQLDQDHRFMLHSQHFAYMPIEEVMKQFHATKVSVMEATRACPYAFPKKIQEEMDRLADEQMLKLKERVDPRGIRAPSPRRRRRDAIDAGSRAGTPCFPQTDAKRVKTPAPPPAPCVASTSE